MTPRPKPPLFLERGSYRRRRLQDAARLLPLLGVVLWLIPLLWTQADPTATVRSSTALIYIFGVWIILIGISFLLSRALRTDAATGGAEDET